MAIHSQELPIAGVVLDVVSNIAGTTILLTGLLAAAFRTFAVLVKAQPERVEWATAYGFLSGTLFAGALLALDVMLG
ncbi:MAG TPA: hypothetical protein VFY48_09625 [Solirubrobacterales bacterium]|nr:hypothetical protein [Solirubrobacterales bacterium]